jgi:hypothetical protein
MLLVDSLEKHGENWDEVVKVFNGRKTKQECLLNLLQLPIKDNIIFKLTDFNKTRDETNKSKDISDKTILNAVNDQNNPIISQVVFFAKMFEKFINEKSKETEKDYSNSDNLKDVIFKTYAKSIEKSKELKANEKNKIDKIMNLLIYLQMKKVEMKLNYFNEFEKLIQFETQQMKSMESQIIQDRIKLAIKKSEVLSQGDKNKQNPKVTENGHMADNHVLENQVRILDLNH